MTHDDQSQYVSVLVHIFMSDWLISLVFLLLAVTSNFFFPLFSLVHCQDFELAVIAGVIVCLFPSWFGLFVFCLELGFTVSLPMSFYIPLPPEYNMRQYPLSRLPASCYFFLLLVILERFSC